jgi:glycosyltransferase involved in cell wall biosynthesis
MVVSVVMVTYGHEKFIKQSIEGVLMQDCDFDIELILANDCSPDLTDEVVRGILENHPKSNWIKYTKHPKNIGMISNFMWAAGQATAKYIALCDGDDYWTDPLKLQKQVDFLEGNADYAGCFHNAYVLNSETNTKTSFLKDDILQTTFTTKDFFEKWLVPTASFMFKNGWKEHLLNDTFPEWFSTIGSGDLALILFVSLKGNIKRLDDNMCVYRRHSGGLTADRAGDPIQFLILGHMYYNFNRETENLFLDDITKGFDVKIKAFYSPYFKSLYENKQGKQDTYSKSKLYEQLGTKKIISLLLHAINKKLFRR